MYIWETAGRTGRAFAASLGLTVVVTVVGARPAKADIPPADACTAPGQPCMNAGPQYDRPGTCAESTCTRTVPAPDGGTMAMTYACNLCKAGGDGGTGGAGAKPPAKSSDGCWVAGGAPLGSWGGGLSTLVAAVGLLVSRIRRRS